MSNHTVILSVDKSAWRLLQVETANSTYIVALHHAGSRHFAVIRGRSATTSREIEIHDTEAHLDDGRSLFDTNPWVDWQGHGLRVGSIQTSEVVRVSTEENAALCNTLTQTYAGLVQPSQPSDGSSREAPLNRTVVRGMKDPSPASPATSNSSAPPRMQMAEPKKPRAIPKTSSVSPIQLVELLERTRSGLQRFCEYQNMRERLCGDPELQKRFDAAMVELVPLAQKATGMTKGSK
jgi:hypothetical protein